MWHICIWKYKLVFRNTNPIIKNTNLSFKKQIHIARDSRCIFVFQHTNLLFRSANINYAKHKFVFSRTNILCKLLQYNKFVFEKQYLLSKKQIRHEKQSHLCFKKQIHNVKVFDIAHLYFPTQIRLWNRKYKLFKNTNLSYKNKSELYYIFHLADLYFKTQILL